MTSLRGITRLIAANKAFLGLEMAFGPPRLSSSRMRVAGACFRHEGVRDTHERVTVEAEHRHLAIERNVGEASERPNARVC